MAPRPRLLDQRPGLTVRPGWRAVARLAALVVVSWALLAAVVVAVVVAVTGVL